MTEMVSDALFSLVDAYEATHGLSALLAIRAAKASELSAYDAGIKRANQVVVNAFRAEGETGIEYLSCLLVKDDCSDAHAECVAHILEELASHTHIPFSATEKLKQRLKRPNWASTDARLEYALREIQKKNWEREHPVSN